MRRILAFVAPLALAFAVSACGSIGGSPTAPSDLQKNLNSAPPGAFEISTQEITVRFWFVFTPAPGSAVGPGDPTRWEFNCRASSGVNYTVSLKFTVMAPDGSVVNSLFPASIDRSTTVCAPGNVASFTGPASPAFKGIKEVRMATTLGPAASASGSTATASFVQPLDWSMR